MKNNTLPYKKLNSMMMISNKGMFIAILLLLLVTAGIYACLFFGSIEQRITKTVYYEGEIDREYMYEYMGRPENGGFTKRDTENQLDKLWKFDKQNNVFHLFTTVLSRREYDSLAPVTGSKVVLPDECSGYVVFVQSYSSYDKLSGLGFSEEILKKMDVYPGEDIYYLLNILSDDSMNQITGKFWDSTITVRSTTLKTLLCGPKFEG